MNLQNIYDFFLLVIVNEILQSYWVAHVEHLTIEADAHHTILFTYLLEGGGELDFTGVVGGGVDIKLELTEDFGGENILPEDTVVVGFAVPGAGLQVGLGIVLGGFLTEGAHAHDSLFLVFPYSGDDAVMGDGVERDGMDGDHRFVISFILFDKLEAAGFVGM